MNSNKLLKPKNAKNAALCQYLIDFGTQKKTNIQPNIGMNQSKQLKSRNAMITALYQFLSDFATQN